MYSKYCQDGLTQNHIASSAAVWKRGAVDVGVGPRIVGVVGGGGGGGGQCSIQVL